MVVCLSLREPRGLLSRRFVCVCLHGNKVQKSLFDGVLCGPRVSFPFFHLNVCAVSLSPVLSLWCVCSLGFQWWFVPVSLFGAVDAKTGTQLRLLCCSRHNVPI